MVAPMIRMLSTQKKEQLTLQDGCVQWGKQVIIPTVAAGKIAKSFMYTWLRY